MKPAITKPMNAKWFRDGKEMLATSTTTHLDSNRIGLRVCEMQWEDGQVDVRLIKGDGRRKGFQVFASGTFFKA